MTRAERRMLEGVLHLMPLPCRCQERFAYRPGNVNDHHPTCEAEKARAALAAPPDAQGGAPVAATPTQLNRERAFRIGAWSPDPAAPGTEAARCEYDYMGLRCCLPLGHGEGHRASVDEVLVWSGRSPGQGAP